MVNQYLISGNWALVQYIFVYDHVVNVTAFAILRLHPKLEKIALPGDLFFFRLKQVV